MGAYKLASTAHELHKCNVGNTTGAGAKLTLHLRGCRADKPVSRRPRKSCRGAACTNEIDHGINNASGYVVAAAVPGSDGTYSAYLIYLPMLFLCSLTTS